MNQNPYREPAQMPVENENKISDVRPEIVIFLRGLIRIISVFIGISIAVSILCGFGSTLFLIFGHKDLIHFSADALLKTGMVGLAAAITVLVSGRLIYEVGR